ncbi:potassium channel family protein [Urbifossiella limnaea]|uniref:Voltage-gated potassium channel Kch n=1 Tax=Urbifossiella limnaea TaxID=2528023 RepID=A0A517XMH6_9BACT|nr:potassium channel protein [Urbifossiella limnaea]QDU18718.1 Voltage-gated potassium channel Kch [Urbifossiella limnaea]
MPPRGLRHLLRLPNRLYRRLLPRRLRRLVLLPLAIAATGTVAYPVIEGPPWTLFDGLYMTVITLTTVGYGEIPTPLSRGGRVFTMALALGGIFVLFYIATDVIRSMLTGELRELLGRERMSDRLKHLRGHLIVCGYGRMGRIVCDELERLGQAFVVVDTGTPPAEEAYRHGLRLQGNATDDEVLRRAGIEHARALITVVGSDAENLYIALSARLLNPTLVLVARAEDEGAEAKLKRVGVNRVVSPYLTGGHRAVQAVLKPTVLQVLDAAARGAFSDLQAVELRVAAGSRLAGVTLHQSRLAPDYEVTVVGVLRPNGDAVNAPTGDTVIEPGAVLVAFGTREALDRVAGLAAAP